MINLTKKSEPSWWTRILNQKWNWNPKKRRAFQISIRWTKSTEPPAAMPLQQMKQQKTRVLLWANVSPFLFRMTSMACFTTDDKQPQDENTAGCCETQSIFHQWINKHNRRKPMPMMWHWIWQRSQSPNNNTQTVLSPQIKVLNNRKVKKIQNTRQRFLKNNQEQTPTRQDTRFTYEHSGYEIHY